MHFLSQQQTSPVPIIHNQISRDTSLQRHQDPLSPNRTRTGGLRSAGCLGRLLDDPRDGLRVGDHPAPGPSPSKIGGTARHALTPREAADWASGAGRALAELITQVIYAKVARTSQAPPTGDGAGFGR